MAKAMPAMPRKGANLGVNSAVDMMADLVDVRVASIRGM